MEMIKKMVDVKYLERKQNAVNELIELINSSNKPVQFEYIVFNLETKYGFGSIFVKKHLDMFIKLNWLKEEAGFYSPVRESNTQPKTEAV